MADGITDEMIESGIAAVIDLGCGPDGCDPDCTCREFDDEDRAVCQRLVRAALEGALAGRTVVDLPAYVAPSQQIADAVKRLAEAGQLTSARKLLHDNSRMTWEEVIAYVDRLAGGGVS